MGNPVDEFKKFVDKIIKPEYKENVERLIDESKDKIEEGVYDVEHFFDEIGDYLVAGSHDLVKKAKEEIEKFTKKDGK